MVRQAHHEGDEFRFHRIVPALGVETPLTAPLGASVADIADVLFNNQPGLEFYIRGAEGKVEWEWIAPNLWRRVKPKRNDVLRVYARMQGGGGGQTLALIGTILISVLAPHIAPALATLFGVGLFGAGTVGGFLVTAGIQLGAAYLIGRLAQQQAVRGVLNEQVQRDTYEDVSADANPSARDAFLPSVYGKTRAIPADVMQPREYLTAGVPSLERLMAFHGPTRITSTRIDGTPASDIAAITVSTDDGRDGQTAQSIVSKYASHVAVGDALSNFSVEGANLEDQTTPANSEPRELRFSTPYPAGMEEIAIRFVLRAFLHATTAATEIRAPFRIRFRPKGGSTWTNLPEIHVTGKDSRTLAKEIRIRWDNQFGDADNVQAIRYDFWQQVPAAANERSSGGTGVQWQAHSHFVSDATILTAVRNMEGRRHGIRVILDAATFPKGEYEWSFIRGAALDKSSLNASYQLSSAVPCLFEGTRATASDPWVAAVDQSNYPADISIPVASAIVAGNPVAASGVAQLALRSVGHNLRAIDCLAEGGLNDWGGADWNSWTWTSRNPAAIARTKLAEYLAKGNVAASLIDNTSILAWRTACAANGWNADGIAAGEPIGELFDSLGKAGFGQLFAARDRFGVHYLKDTSGVTPKMAFGPRNVSNLTVNWEEPELPLGLKVKFIDENDGYRENEILVPSPVPVNVNTWMPAEFPSVKSATQVRALAEYAMLTAYHQTIRFRLETALEGIAIWPGDIVAVAHDLLDDSLHSARVSSVRDSTHITLDQDIPGVAADVNVSESAEPVIDDVLAAGEFSELSIVTPNGVEKSEILAVAGRELTLAAPLSTVTDIVGSPVTIGSQRTPAKRMIVLHTEPGEEFSTVLTLTHEAPEIWAYLKQKYGWA